MATINIRPEQMAALEITTRESLEARIAAYIRETYPEAVADLDRRRLGQAVSSAVERAVGYGFERQSNILAFAALTFTVGRDFDRHPRISAILSDANVPPDSKIEYLASAITPEEWKEAKSS